MTTADTNVIARAGTAGRAPLGLGSFGVWMTSQAASPELAIAVERLGYGAIWLGSADGDLRLAEKLLEATSTLTVATGIVNIWTYPRRSAPHGTGSSRPIRDGCCSASASATARSPAPPMRGRTKR
ncbi:MAG TPA: hypothetical protein VGG16_10735 [Streptosporangiaceae bacterium]|jgi:hypothetical protein